MYIQNIFHSNDIRLISMGVREAYVDLWGCAHNMHIKIRRA